MVVNASAGLGKVVSPDFSVCLHDSTLKKLSVGKEEPCLPMWMATSQSAESLIEARGSKQEIVNFV